MEKNKKIIFAFVILSLLLVSGCAKPMVQGSTKDSKEVVTEEFSYEYEKVFAAAKEALVISGYPISFIDQKGGAIESSWVPSTSDSHYIGYFGRKDYGVTGAYHQLVIGITKDSSSVKVRVFSRVKALAQGIQSSLIEEKKFLKNLSNILRKSEPEVSNIGVKK